MDPAHPFPFVSNLSLNLLVTLRAPHVPEPSLARVKVPVGIGAPRFLRVGERDRFIPLEEVMSNNLDMLFPEMEVLSCELFRVTRNANTERNEEHADDLLAMIETELQHRKFAPIVRLEVKTGMDPVHRGMLAAELALDESADVFEVGGMLAMRDLFELADLDRPGAALPAPHPPRPPAAADRAQHLPHPPRRRLDPAAPPLRIVLHLGGALPPGGRQRPQGAGDQDDPLPHLEPEPHRRPPDHRGAQRQAGGGGGRAQGALRRGGQHPPGEPHGGGRHPRHLRRGGAEDPLQGDPGGAPGLQRHPPLRPLRHRQLPPRHRPPLLRLRPVDRRPAARRGRHRALQLPDHRLHPEAPLPQAAAGAQAAEEGAAGEDRAGDRRSQKGAAGAAALQDERPRRHRDHPRPLPGLPRRGARSSCWCATAAGCGRESPGCRRRSA